MSFATAATTVTANKTAALDLPTFRQRVRRLAIRTARDEDWNGLDQALKHLGLEPYAEYTYVATVAAGLNTDVYSGDIVAMARLLTVHSQDTDVVIVETLRSVSLEDNQLIAEVRATVHNASTPEIAERWVRETLHLAPSAPDAVVPRLEPNRVAAVTYEDRADPDLPDTYEEDPEPAITEPAGELAEFMQRTRRLAIRVQRNQDWCEAGLNRGLRHLGLAPYHDGVDLRGEVTMTVRSATTLTGIAPLLRVESSDCDVTIIKQPEWVSDEGSVSDEGGRLTVKVAVAVSNACGLAVAEHWVREALNVKPFSDYVDVPDIYLGSNEVAWIDHDPDMPGTYEIAADLTPDDWGSAPPVGTSAPEADCPF